MAVRNRIRLRPRSWARRFALSSGLAAAAILIPQALAFATIAGVSPIAGLYAALPALLVYAALCPGRPAIVGPLPVTAALAAAIVATQAGGGSAAMLATLAILSGGLGLAAAALRLSFVGGFLPVPVLKGFVGGLALAVIAGQLVALLGLGQPRAGFLENVNLLAGSSGEIHGWSALLGIGSLVVLFELRQKLPRFPSMALVLAVSLVAVGLAGLGQRGVLLIGDVDSGLPRLGWPGGIDADAARTLIPGAGALVLLAMAQSLATTKAAMRLGGAAESADRELARLSAANLGAGLLGGMPVERNALDTAPDAPPGAGSRGATLLTAACVAATVLLLSGLAQYLAAPVLAAIAIAVTADFADLGYLRRSFRLARAEGGITGVSSARTLQDLAAGGCVLAGVLALGILPGFLVMIAASVVLLMLRVSRPGVAIVSGPALVESPLTPPTVLILKLRSNLIYANADGLRDLVTRVLETRDASTVVIDLEEAPIIDVAGIEVLIDLDAALADSTRHLAVVRSLGPARRLLDAVALSAGVKLDTYGSVSSALAHLYPPAANRVRARRAA